MEYLMIQNIDGNKVFDPSDPKQYNHKVLIANEKYDRLSLIISENLPMRIAEKMESILINSDNTFNLNIKKEIPPNLHGNDLICIHTENYLHVYPKIDGEILYHSPELEKNNNRKLSLWKKEREKERLKKLEDEKRKDEEKKRKIELKKQNERKERLKKEKKKDRLDRLAKQKREDERLGRLAKTNGVTIDEIQRLGRLAKQNGVTIDEIQRLGRLAKQNGVTIARQKRIEELVEQSRQTEGGIRRLERLAKTKGTVEENTILKEIIRQKRERKEEIARQEREKERLKKLEDEKRKEKEKERKIELEKRKERSKKLADETRKKWEKERLDRLSKQKKEDERLDRLAKQNGVTIEEVKMLEELAKRNLIDMPNSEGVYTTNRFVHINFQIKGTEDLKRIESEIKKIKKMENLMIPITDIQKIFNELDEFKKKVEQGLKKIYSSTESRSDKIKIFEDLKNEWEEIRSQINNSKIELKINFNTLVNEFKKIDDQAVD